MKVVCANLGENLCYKTHIEDFLDKYFKAQLRESKLNELGIINYYYDRRRIRKII